jgi:hypothetical protein
MEESLIAEAFPEHVLESIEIISSIEMGFSGANVKEISCIWRNGSSSSEELPPSVLFIKNITFTTLPEEPDARAKELRNRQSYHNEIAVVENYNKDLASIGLETPKVFKQIHIPGENDEQFIFLSESVKPIAAQYADYNLNQVHSVIDWIAKMHAYYMRHEKTIPDPEADIKPKDPHSINRRFGIWNQGTHLLLYKRPIKELNSIATSWKSFCTSFNNLLRNNNNNNINEYIQLGERIEVLKDYIGSSLNVYNYKRNLHKTTLVHGDCKPGNVFLKKNVNTDTDANADAGSSSSSRSSSSSSDNVILIDFQWSGIGLASTDLAYLVVMSLSDDVILNKEKGENENENGNENATNPFNIENDVIKPYYKILSSSYDRYHSTATATTTTTNANADANADADASEEIFGSTEKSAETTAEISTETEIRLFEEMYTYKEFHYDFQLSILDFMRWALPARLSKQTPETYSKRSLPDGVVDINDSAYKRSTVMMKFLMDLTREYLPIVEARSKEEL